MSSASVEARPGALTLPPADSAAAAEFLHAGDDFLLASHVGADADAVASCLALQRLLRLRGKRARIVLAESPAPRYRFLAGVDTIAVHADGDAPPAAWAVVLDAPSLARTGPVAARVGPHTRVLNLDHHPDNQRFGTVNLAPAEVSSTCELVYHLAVTMGLAIDAETAAALYTGIVFDTGGFRFSLTTATTLEVGAALVRAGADLDDIAQRLFSSKPLAELLQLRSALCTLALHAGDRVAVMYLDHAAMAAGDPEEVVNYGLMVEGVQVAVLVRENEPGRHRVSLRSRAAVDVGQVAAQFGGGGHRRAAGCRLEAPREVVVAQLLAAIEPRLPH